MLKTLLPDQQTINVVVKFILYPVKCTVCTSHHKHSVYDMERPITYNNTQICWKNCMQKFTIKQQFPVINYNSRFVLEMEDLKKAENLGVENG